MLIPVGALVSTLSAANANILGSSEIMVRLAVNKDVPTVLGRMWHGHPAVSVDVLTAIQVTSSAGDEVDVVYVRGGHEHTTTVTLR